MTEDDIPADFLRDFSALYSNSTPIEIVTTRYRLWCLMSAVQLASRHPQAMQAKPMQIAVEMARSIQVMLSTTPALARVAEEGWSLTHDGSWQ